MEAHESRNRYYKSANDLRECLMYCLEKDDPDLMYLFNFLNIKRTNVIGGRQWDLSRSSGSPPTQS